LPNSLDVAVGERIRKRREELTLTAKHLAEMIGVSEQEMLDFESGSERVDAALCYRIATALGVKPDVLICNDDPGAVK